MKKKLNKNKRKAKGKEEQLNEIIKCLKKENNKKTKWHKQQQRKYQKSTKTLDFGNER